MRARLRFKAACSRLKTFTAKAHRFRLHPVFIFSRLSNQRFVRSLTLIKFAYRSQRRLTTVTAKAHRFRLHPVFIFSRLSNQRFVRSLTLIKFAYRSQRRRSIVTQFVLLNASQMLHPVNFFPACQIKDLSVRCRSQRRLTTVTAKAHRFRLHPVLFNLSSLPRAFALLMFFIDSYGQVSTT